MKHLEKIRFMAINLFIAVLSLSFASCSDDDDPVPTITDYYMTCTVTGGGLSPQELDNLEANLNAELTQYYWEAQELDYVLYYFNSEVEDWQDVFSEGVDGISGTLQITFQLKTKEGQTVRTATLNVTENGCTIS